MHGPHTQFAVQGTKGHDWLQGRHSTPPFDPIAVVVAVPQQLDWVPVVGLLHLRTHRRQCAGS